jgi:hypothetical protein
MPAACLPPKRFDMALELTMYDERRRKKLSDLFDWSMNKALIKIV